jgi:AbrB family looped-hinge helix DNA binding protein
MDTLLDKFGRVVIPKQIRENLGLQPGAKIHIEEDECEIRLIPLHGEPDVKMKEGVLVFTGTATGDIRNALRNLREERTKGMGF